MSKHFDKAVGTKSAVMLLTGVVIGSGIFASPGFVIEVSPRLSTSPAG